MSLYYIVYFKFQSPYNVPEYYIAGGSRGATNFFDIDETTGRLFVKQRLYSSGKPTADSTYTVCIWNNYLDLRQQIKSALTFLNQYIYLLQNASVVNLVKDKVMNLPCFEFRITHSYYAPLQRRGGILFC